MSALRILHLTDTHLFGDESRHYGVVDTSEHLRLALAQVGSREFDLVVCSGDVSEDGSEASYVLARTEIGGWATARGARAVFAMGNHDRRAEFRAVLGDGQPGADAASFAADPDPIAPIASIAVSEGWRTIVLDTSVPGAGYGALGGEQLDFLCDALSEPAEHGTVIVMHHPPVAAETDLLDALRLDDADTDAFWDLVRGSDVRAVLCGHYHHPIVETREGIPVVVAPGVANVARAFGPPAEESAAALAGGAVVEVTPSGVRAQPFTRAATEREVFRLDAAAVRRTIEVAGRDAGLAE